MVSLTSWWHRSAPQQGHRPRILQSEQGRFFFHRSSACQLGQDKLWWCTSVLWHEMAVWASGKRCLRIEKYILKQWQTQRRKDNFQLFAKLIWKQNERENVWEYRLEAKPGQNQDRLFDKFAWSPFSRVSRAVWLSTCRVQRPVKNIFLPVINETDVASSQKQPARPTIYSLPHNKNRRLYHQPQCLEVQYSLVTNRFGWVKRNQCTRAENGWNTYECVNLYPCIRCVGTMYGDCTLVYPQAKTCLWSLLLMFVAAPKKGWKRLGKTLVPTCSLERWIERSHYSAWHKELSNVLYSAYCTWHSKCRNHIYQQNLNKGCTLAKALGGIGLWPISAVCTLTCESGWLVIEGIGVCSRTTSPQIVWHYPDVYGRRWWSIWCSVHHAWYGASQLECTRLPLDHDQIWDHTVTFLDAFYNKNVM